MFISREKKGFYTRIFCLQIIWKKELLEDAIETIPVLAETDCEFECGMDGRYVWIPLKRELMFDEDNEPSPYEDEADCTSCTITHQLELVFF